MRPQGGRGAAEPPGYGAVDAPIGNCWITRGPLGHGLRVVEGAFHERGAAGRTSCSDAGLLAAINPAARTYLAEQG